MMALVGAATPALAAEAPAPHMTTDSHGRPVTLEKDRDGDGQVDLWATYTYTPTTPGQPDEKRAALAVDRNHDGLPDFWREERKNRPVREWGDLNDDGRVDTWIFYDAEGHKIWTVMDKNFDGRPDAWFYYGPKGQAVPGLEKPVAGEIDEHFDGHPKMFGELPKTRPTLADLTTPPPAVGPPPKPATSAPARLSS